MSFFRTFNLHFKNITRYIWTHKPLLALIVIAGLTQLFIIFPSGTYLCIKNTCGDFFWGVHEHDGIWHLAVAASSFKGWPFLHPVYGGEVLAGYNLLLDIVVFLLSKVGVGPLISYFKLLPVIWFVFFTYLAVAYARTVHKSTWFVWLLLFLFYFGASLSFLIQFMHKNITLFGSSGLLTMQALLTLTNLQVAFSYALLLGMMLLILKKPLTIRLASSLSILVFLLLGLKFYAGIVSGILVGVYFLIQLINKKDTRLLLYFIILFGFSVLSVLLFYNPFQAAKSGLNIFTFKPFAIVHPIIEDPSLIYMKDTVNARYFLEQTGRFSPRLVYIELLSLTLFLVFNLGVRIIGLLYLSVQLIRRKLTDLDVAVFVAILFSLLFPVFFIQKGEWWNSIQFFYYGTFLLNIYTALALIRIKRKNFLLCITALIVLISLPYDIDALHTYLPTLGGVYITKGELKALDYLKNQSAGTVLVPPYDISLKGKYGSYKPLYANNDTAYVAAYTGKPEYLADKIQLGLTNIGYLARLTKLQNGDCSAIQEVRYVYYNSSQTDTFFKKCVEKNPLLRLGYAKDGYLIYSKTK